MDEKVTAALIAASVSAVGSVLTLLGARWQVKSKLRELEQTQLKDVLQARIKAYPRLWRILQAQVSNWRMEGKTAVRHMGQEALRGPQLVPCDIRGIVLTAGLRFVL